MPDLGSPVPQDQDLRNQPYLARGYQRGTPIRAGSGGLRSGAQGTVRERPRAQGYLMLLRLPTVLDSCEKILSSGINSVMEEQVTTTTTSQPTVNYYSLENVRDMGSLGRMVYRKDAMKFLNIQKATVLRYEKRGLLLPIKNQANGRVMYTEANVVAVLGSKLKQTKQVVLYCRVAVLGSRGEPGESAPARLSRQVDRMQDYCVRAGIRVDEVIKDIGPVNGRKALEGHDRLMELVLRRQVSLLVVETEDRIARWGMGHLFRRFLEWHGVEVHVASPVLLREEYREEIKQDLTELIYEARKALGEIG